MVDPIALLTSDLCFKLWVKLLSTPPIVPPVDHPYHLQHALDVKNEATHGAY